MMVSYEIKAATKIWLILVRKTDIALNRYRGSARLHVAIASSLSVLLLRFLHSMPLVVEHGGGQGRPKRIYKPRLSLNDISCQYLAMGVVSAAITLSCGGCRIIQGWPVEKRERRIRKGGTMKAKLIAPLSLLGLALLGLNTPAAADKVTLSIEYSDILYTPSIRNKSDINNVDCDSG
jgi:hypothetical protein